MPDIFISYARSDRNRVALIAAALEAEGYDIWWDRVLQPGKPFRDDIEENIKTAKCVLVVWSHDSVRRNFVIEEAQEGADNHILVSVMIDDVVDEIPRGFKSLQAADLTRWRGDRSNREWRLVLSRVKTLVEQPAGRRKRYKRPKVKRPADNRALWGVFLFITVALTGFTAMNTNALLPYLEKVGLLESADTAISDEFAVDVRQATMVVHIRRISVYEKPSLASDKKGAFEPEEQVIVSGVVEKGIDGRKWYQVVAPDGSVGYVLAEGLAENKNNNENPEPEESEPLNEIQDCEQCPSLAIVPPGTFNMGDIAGNGKPDELPVHSVEIAKPFAVGRYEVTWAEWEACAEDGVCTSEVDDEGWARGDRPVINVTWEDAQFFLSWLRRKTNIRYRLLSEAEWEYAARAGSEADYFFDGPPSDMCDFANGADLSNRRNDSAACTDGYGKVTSPVGSFRANAFGLYDMHGNVREWVQDCWNSTYVGAPEDGAAWQSGVCSRRVQRGGSWDDSPEDMRSSYRFWQSTTLTNSAVGFRVARDLTESEMERYESADTAVSE